MSKSRQQNFYQWVRDTYGPEASGPRERALRFTEEALEVAEASGLTIVDVMKLVGRAFSRPTGKLRVELAQAVLTLEGLAESYGYDVHDDADKELERVRALPASYWHDRHNRKVVEGVTASGKVG